MLYCIVFISALSTNLALGHVLLSPLVFNAGYYLAKYQDLRAAGFDHHAAARHWLQHGISEGRQASAGFHSTQYLARYPDLTAAFGQNKRAATTHYINHGHREKRVGFVNLNGRPDVTHAWVFNAEFYKNKYSDLRAAGLLTPNALAQHFQNHGVDEGRQAHPGFLSVQYLQRYPDLTAAFGQNKRAATTHYINHGHSEKRVGFVNLNGRPDATHAWVFNAEFYKNKYSDLRAAGLLTPNALAQHFQTQGVDEGRQAHPGFHSVQYLQRYPDLTAAFGQNKRAATTHYINHGHSENRVGFVNVNGRPDVTHAWVFNAEFYKNKYSDLRAAGLLTPNTLAQHFQDYGVDEGRQAHPGFHSVQYLQRYPDLTAAFEQNKRAATTHYINHGHSESRVGFVNVNGRPDVTHAYVFNFEFYKTKYADLSEAGLLTPNALAQHWQDYGVDEGRQAHPGFLAEPYLHRYPDLVTAFGDSKRAAAAHYISYGYGEQRVGFVNINDGAFDVTHAWVFNTEFYKNTYSDLREAGLLTANALAQHWQDYGVNEGRQAHPDFSVQAFLQENDHSRKVFGTNYRQVVTYHVLTKRGSICLNDD